MHASMDKIWMINGRITNFDSGRRFQRLLFYSKTCKFCFYIYKLGHYEEEMNANVRPMISAYALINYQDHLYTSPVSAYYYKYNLGHM